MAYNKITDISKILSDYVDDVSESITEKAIEIATEGQTTLKQTNQPSGSGGTANPSTRRMWNKYSKGWRVYTRTGVNFVHCYVYNATDYQLTHLLEYGHMTRDGKKTRAFPHIKPVEDKCNDEFVKEVEVILKKGGK